MLLQVASSMFCLGNTYQKEKYIMSMWVLFKLDPSPCVVIPSKELFLKHTAVNLFFFCRQYIKNSLRLISSVNVELSC